MDSQDKRDNINAMIEAVGEADPGLIYNIIMYLKILDVDPPAARKSLAYLNSLKNEHYNRMNLWISNEFDIVNSKTVSIAQWMRLWSYLLLLKHNPEKEIIQESPGYETDNNFRNYIIFLFMKKNYEEYDSSVNYQNQVTGLVSQVTGKFREVYDNAEVLDEETLSSYYKLAKEFPLIFKGSILSHIKEPVPFYLSEFLIKVTEKNYRQKSTLSAGVERDAYNNQKAFTSLYKDDRFELETKVSDLTRSSVYFGGGFSLKTREYKTYFSSIGFSFLAASTSEKEATAQQSNLLSAQKYYIVYNNNIGSRIDPNFQVDNLKYSSVHYQGKLYTPIIHLLSNLSLNAGILLRYSAYEYKCRYERNDTFYRNAGASDSVLVKYSKDVEYSNTEFVYSPLISVNYSPLKFIDFRLTLYDFDIPQLDVFIVYPF
jgi:hypothetical protein